MNHPIVLSDPLPAPYVTDIDQDSTGFIWIGTREGLCRYDGSSIVTFQHEPGNPTSLADNFVNDILCDKQRNLLWIGTDNGLSILDLSDETFYNPHIPGTGDTQEDAEVLALCFDNAHQLWFSVSGIGLATYSDQNDTVFVYPMNGTLPEPMQLRQQKEIMDLAMDPARPRTFWMGTKGGLVRFDIDSSRYVPYFFRLPDLESQIYQNQIRSVLPLENSQLYLGPWSAGMFAFTPDRTAVAPQFIEPDEYTRFGGSSVVPPFFLADARHAYCNRIASCLLDLESLQTFDCITMHNALGKWYSIQINYADKQERLWAASEYGVHIFDPLAQQIENFQFPAKDMLYYIRGRFTEDAHGHIFITYENSEGVYAFDEQSGECHIIRAPLDANMPDSLFNGIGFIHRPNGEIWIANRQKFFLLSEHPENLIPLHLPIDSLPHLWSSVTQDRDGALWLGTGTSGLIYVNPATNETRTFREERETGKEDVVSEIHFLLEDHSRNIWISKEWGYSVYLRNENRFLNFNTIHGQKFKLTNFIVDSMGNIWAGCPGVGLVKMRTASPEQGIVEILDTGDGLLSVEIYSLAFDHKGRLWMITRDGLQEYDPVNHTTRLYNEKDGMIMYDARFNRNPAVLSNLGLLSDGRMAYAPRAGFSIFDPDSMRINTEIPRPYLRRIIVADTTIATDLFPPFQMRSFPFRQNHLEVECSAIAYTHAAQLQYEYHLGEGQWREMDSRRVQFSSLAPGGYQLYFRVVNSAGMPSATLHWDFTILVPWWRSWWFIALCGSTAVAGIWYAVRIREQHRERLQQKEREVQMLMVGLESRALRNQMNPHFLFNIFNNIQELILTGNTEKAYTYTTKFSKLLRMILDNARKDEITIEQERVFLQLYLELESLRFDDAFEYSIEVEEGLELMHIPAFVIQPLVENAIRHGLLPKEGDKSLDICFSSDGDHIFCTVTDNGVGLNGSTAPSTPKDRDHALMLIRHRLQLLNGGSLTMTNQRAGDGTMAQVKIPMRHASY